MDELSPEAEAKDMELVATRGEDEQGSEAQFSPSSGGNEAKRTLRGRVSPETHPREESNVPTMEYLLSLISSFLSEARGKKIPNS